ncbi:MAG: PDZ domain-containing protein [Deltaproteobacteria bacterium]|nr:PDZ domain-containing protein [Deltaproteobacteria bacterium]
MGLSLLERQYLFEDELVPEALFDKALGVFEREVDDFRSRKTGDRAWLLTTPDCELRIELDPGTTIRGLEAPLRRTGTFLKACAREMPKEMPPLESFLLGGIVSGLDPYTTVFDEKGETEHNIQFQGKLAGIGARIGVRDDQLVLMTVYPLSPAARAGLRDGDVVLRINDMSARNILVSDAVERIRGDEGTTVALTIQRKGETSPRVVTVTRGIVMIPSVTSRMLSGEVLYTEISHFSQTTPDDFRSHVAAAVDEGRVRGVLIDLRKNSGGSMLGSSAIGDLFLGQGTLISTAGRGGTPARGLTAEVLATDDTPFVALPVVFLTSPVSASGSELLAASLRNNDRALIVGEHSFGKGTVQKTFPLDAESTLKMTVGHFLPNGRPIPGGGLAPDVEILAYRVGDGRLSIPFPAHRSDLPFWLRLPKWSHEGLPKPAFSLAFASAMTREEITRAERREQGLEEPDGNADGEEKKDDMIDRPLEVAAALLRNYGDTSASAMLENARDFLARSAEAADADLSDFMYERGMDWTYGPRPQSRPDFSLEVLPYSRMRAGEEDTVEVRITNRSSAPFYRVRGLLQSTSAALDGRAVAFGRVEPGDTRSWKAKVRVPRSSRTGRVEVKALLFDDEGEISKAGPVRFVLEEEPRPHLAFRHLVIAAAEAADVLDIRFEVENRGSGPATDVRARLEHPLNGQFEIIEGSGVAKDLAPGATTTFTLRVREQGSFQTPPVAKLFLADAPHAIFLESEFPLTPAPAPSDWKTSPRIVVETIEAQADGSYDLVVRADDDRALEHVRARVDDDTVAYAEPDADHPGAVELHVPWKPADEVKPLRILAIDDDGLREVYLGTL